MAERDLNEETTTLTLLVQHLQAHGVPNGYLVARDREGNRYPIVPGVRRGVEHFQYELMLGEPVREETASRRKAKRDEMMAQASRIACDTVMHPSPMGNLLRGLVDIVFEAESNIDLLAKRVEELQADKDVAEAGKVKSDYQALLAKYMWYVLSMEGSTFVNDIARSTAFGKDEIDALDRIHARVQKYEAAPFNRIPPEVFSPE